MEDEEEDDEENEALWTSSLLPDDRDSEEFHWAWPSLPGGSEIGLGAPKRL